MATTGHENEVVRVSGLKATIKKGGNLGIFNKGTCSVASATAAKTVTVGAAFSLVEGATILVRFTYGISAENPTLSVNSGDAKPIYYQGAALASGLVKAKDTLMLKYNGSQWDIVGSLGEIYESKAAASGGTDVSLVTTGDKYAWNQKAAGSHTHGNITNDGKLQTSDVAIDSGDKLVITDSSDGGKVARASIAFDGSTATQALTKKGTFETFNNYTHPSYDAATAAAKKIGRDATGHVVIGDSLTASDVDAIPTSEKGAANGVASLDSTGKVPSSQLPSYVDDVLEYDAKSSFPTTGETGKIYVDKATDTTWRWSGSAYVQIKGDLALGETSSTAYRGDRGKTAYDHSQSPHARTDATKTEASTTNGNIKINDTETTVYTHPTTAGNKHIPSGGSSGQFLGYNANGEAKWVSNPNTDTSVTAVGNHYSPSADSSAELTASLDGNEGAYAINTEYSVVTGVKAQRDAKGHVTGLKVTKQKVKDTNTHTAPTSAEVKSALGTGSGTTKFLREDGTWQQPSANVPNNVALLENTDSTAYSPDFDAETDTVHVTAQSLTTAQKTQARTNIGAADASTTVNSTVIRNIVTISQADYDNLSSKDNNTLYIIV